MKNTTKFIFISLLIFIAIYFLENINHRFWLNDFKVYYFAAKALIQGDQVYGISFGLGTGYYKYSPFTLLFFTPFSLLSYPVASSIHFFIIACAIIGLLILLSKLFVKYWKFEEVRRIHLLLIAILVSAMPHFFRDLHLGNLNAILIFIMCIALWLLLEERTIPAGILLSLAFLCKPYFLLLLLPLIFHRKLKVLLVMAISTIIFTFIPSFFLGFSKNIFLVKSWVIAMYQHNDYLYSNHTVSALIKNYFWQSCPNIISFYILILFVIMYIIYFFFTKGKERKIQNTTTPSNQSFIIQYFLTIAIIPSLLITDTEHFMYVTPFIGLLIFVLNSYRNYFYISLFILLIILYSDLTPSYWGLLGISNLLIISSVLYLFSGNQLWMKIFGKKRRAIQ
ncbi:MAG: glycosyltransferase family 87 protein [Bacteroidota bacterium]|nr:glycosyltransferase family 87 protein [Bacteroidota bacterium]